MPRPLTNRWFRLWSPDLFGPDPDGFDERKDLEPQERLCWHLLMAMCAMSSLQPAVCRSPLIGYTDGEIAETMAVYPNVWKTCKQKLILAGKIDVDSQNVIVVRDWTRHGARGFRGHTNSDDASLRALSIEEELRLRGIDKEKAVLYSEVIKHLNEASGRNFKLSCKVSFSHVSARFDDGYRLEDFKHVIDVKCQQWVGNPKMEPYLRPETLFAAKYFDAYRQERLIVRKGPIGGTGSMTIFPEDRTKYEAEFKVEYEKKMAEKMIEYGWKTAADIDYFKVPTFQEFFKMRLKEKKDSGEWSLEIDGKKEKP